MPRKNLIRHSSHPYHVVSRSHNKEWFSLPLESLWPMAKDCLKLAYQKHPVELISFVLMSNHYHMLLRTPDCNIDLFMYEFNKNLALGIQRKSGVINKVFGNRYKWCLIQNQTYFFNCYKYVYQNPLRAKLCNKCEDYPYSTLSYLEKGKTFPVPIYDQFGFKDYYSLRPLNVIYTDVQTELIRKSLNKTTLNSIVDSSTRKSVHLN